MFSYEKEFIRSVFEKFSGSINLLRGYFFSLLIDILFLVILFFIFFE